MALNPPLNETNEPISSEDELNIVKSNGIEFEIIIDKVGKLKGTGHCIISTLRIVLINKYKGS